ncbi:hypothetical protein BGZ73_009246, partial [Actinomortierella ambigua]
MDGGAFQGMPRIALTPAEEAMLPRPHSSASQVASAIPSTYTRTAASSRYPYHHPAASSSFVGTHNGTAGSSSGVGPITSSAAILAAAAASVSSIGLSRPVSPGPLRPASPSKHPHGQDRNDSEAEYPQNPQDDYYHNRTQQQVPPRPSSPAPRIPFSIPQRPVRSPSPQLHSNLFQNTPQGYRPYYPRASYDTHPRPGSPLQQEHQETWDSSIRIESPEPGSDSEDIVRVADNNDPSRGEEGTVGEGRGAVAGEQPPLGARKKSLLRRLQEHTPRISFSDDSSSRADQHPPQRSSQESDKVRRRSSVDSTTRPDLSILMTSSEFPRRPSKDDRPEPRKSRSSWRPSLSIIRQESNNSNPHGRVYAQNERPDHGQKRRRKGKGDKRRRRKGKKTVQLSDEPHYFPGDPHDQEEQGVFSFLRRSSRAEEQLVLPSLQHVLNKRTRYPLSYEDFEAFLRSHRAVEYLHFWADVAAHEQLCRTFDVSERRQKRELQLEERALARDRRRLAMAAALEAGRSTPEQEGTALAVPSLGAGGDHAASNSYAASRSSLQLPLNDHLSFPLEARRYGITDPAAPYGPIPPTYSQGRQSGAYNRLLSGGNGSGRFRSSVEMNRPSMEEEHIQEQDAAVAAVAMKSGRFMHGPYSPPRRQDSWSQSGDDARRGSSDVPRAASPGAGMMSHNSAYSTLYNGRGSIDLLRRSSSRASRTRHLGDDYFGQGMRRTSSQQFYYQQQLQHQHQRHLQQLQLQQHQHSLDSSLKNELDDSAENSAQSGQVTPNNPDDASPTVKPVPTNPSPEPMSDQSGTLHKSSSLTFANRPSLQGSSSYTRHHQGVGPLQPPVTIRRSGESAYAPSLFSQEGKPIMALSFRTITPEDIQESALRLYRKYLIQLRTASMAAEEAAAEANQEKGRHASLASQRNSLEKPAMVPGWEGYAEEVIAQWNESWRGRTRIARRRRSSRRSIPSRRSIAVDEAANDTQDDDQNELTATTARNLRINTEAANKHSNVDSEDEGDVDGEDNDVVDGQLKTPKSPHTPRVRRRTVSGIGAALSPFLPKFLKTETVVTELPTLTVNTTTVEENDYYSYDEDDEGSEYETDDEDEGSESEEESGNEEKKAMKEGQAEAKSEQTPRLTTSTKPESEELNEKVEVADRSITFAPVTPKMEPERPADNTALVSPAGTGPSSLNTIASPESPVPTSSSPRPTRPPRSRGTSVSSHNSWVRLSYHDLDKADQSMPISSSTRSSARLIRGIRGSGGVQSRPGKAATAASHTARKMGLQLSNIIRNKNAESSPDRMQISSPVIVHPPHLESATTHGEGGDLALPPIIITKQTPDGSPEYLSTDARVHPLDLNNMTPTPPMAAQNTTPGTQGFLTPRQQDFIGSNNTSSLVSQPPSLTTSAMSSLSDGSPMRPPASSAVSSFQDTRNSQSSSQVAAMASSAAAAAFYLPLEIRQRIHHQVQKENRTENPHLFGPAKGFVVDIVLQDYYFPLFLEYAQSQNLGLLTKPHPKNRLKQRGMLWIGLAGWIVVLGIQLSLVLLGLGGWASPWVWLTGILGGWSSSVFVATGVTGFSPMLGIFGKMVDDKRFFQFRRILEPSIRYQHRQRALWMIGYCIFLSSIIMIHEDSHGDLVDIGARGVSNTPPEIMTSTTHATSESCLAPVPSTTSSKEPMPSPTVGLTLPQAYPRQRTAQRLESVEINLGVLAQESKTWQDTSSVVPNVDSNQTSPPTVRSQAPQALLSSPHKPMARNMFRDSSQRLQDLPKAHWCPEEDHRSELLHHAPDSPLHTQMDNRRQLRSISVCPWPSQYNRYRYFDAQGRRVSWFGAHDPATGKLIAVADDDEDYKFFLQAFPGGRREVVQGPVIALTGSRLQGVLFHLGGSKMIDEIREQQRERHARLSILKKAEADEFSDDDLEPVTATTA